MVNKRGQITVYIIIGIIAIMGLGVFMYMRGQRLPSQMLVSPTIEEIPTEAKPVSDFITDCLDATARSALERVGVQGGYTTNENMGGISNRVFPTEGDVVELFPKSKINVPYWYYISSDSETCFQTGQCRVDSKRPNLYRQQGDPSIEGQLDKFIEENVRVCLAGFSDFAEMGFEIREKGSPNVQTTITEKTVAFYMEYPFQITRGDTSFEIKQFFVDEPVRLKRMYELATNITNLQGTANFLEKYLLNLIPVYSSLNSNALPPFKASSFEFGPGEMWIDQTVKQRVEGILRKDIQLLHVFGTQNFENIPVSRNVGNTELNSVFKNRLTVIPVLDAFPGMEASFVYLDWPIYFDLICEAGGESMCRPSSLLSFIIMPFAMQEYKTSYFISFPILVELKDTEAYNGEGYFFNFFLEGNIANNNPVEIGKALSIQQTLGVPSQFCLRRMWDSPNITVTVWDKKEFGPLEGVNVNYGCGADSCLIGTTGEDGKLNAQFPRCIGGTLSLKKEHYLGAVGALSTELTGPRDDIKVYLEPKRKVDIVVKKIILLT